MGESERSKFRSLSRAARFTNLESENMLDETLELALTCAERWPLTIEALKYFTTPNDAPHFVNFVQQQIENSFGTSEMFRRGFEIRTTLIPRIQDTAQNALEVLGDLYRTLDDRTADALAGAIRVAKRLDRKTLRTLRNPWAS